MGFIEPLAFVDYLAAGDDAVKMLAPHVGVNFWINKYTFNAKVDVGYIQTDTKVVDAMTAMTTTDTNKDIIGTVQTQVFF
jgi:hypothetical protein